MKIAKIDTNVKNFFYHWIRFIEPFHHLGKTEKKIISELLYYRYMLMQEVRSEELLYKLLLRSSDLRTKISDSIGIPKTRLTVIISNFRKDGIIKDGKINKAFIPDIKPGDKEFILAFKFNLHGNEKGLYKKKSKEALRENST